MTAIHHDDPDETIEPLAEDNDPPFSLPDYIASDYNSSDDNYDSDDDSTDTVGPTDLATDIDIDEAYAIECDAINNI